MGTFWTFFVYVGFLSLVYASDIFEKDDLKHRLASIEATLELVLQKNGQLEKRVEALESENKDLKLTVASLQVEVQQKRSCETEKEKAKDTSSINLPDKAHGNALENSNSTEPKLKRQAGIVSSTVAFTAVVNQPSLTNLGSGQTLIYDTVITNVGGGYHSTTGVFTAPHSGIYVFNFALMIDPGNNEYTELVKNGQFVISNYGHGFGSSHLSSASRTTTLELKVGDEVWVRTGAFSTHGTGTVHGYGYTTFSGWINELTE